MKAPEKIYIDDPTGEFDDHWSIYQNNDSIEYTRTDALIEKAREYLQERLIDYWSQGVTDESKFIDEFIEYIKGE